MSKMDAMTSRSTRLDSCPKSYIRSYIYKLRIGPDINLFVIDNMPYWAGH